VPQMLNNVDFSQLATGLPHPQTVTHLKKIT